MDGFATVDMYMELPIKRIKKIPVGYLWSSFGEPILPRSAIYGVISVSFHCAFELVVEWSLSEFKRGSCEQSV